MKRYLLYFIILIFTSAIITCQNKRKLVYEMVLVENGTFIMGDNNGESAEGPEHKVVITKSYYIGKYEVTYDLYDKFCEDTGLVKQTDNGWGRGKRPVMLGNFFEALKFCNWLSKQAGYKACYNFTGKDKVVWNKSANGFRLPTEAEWEFAARGGVKSKGYIYSGSNNFLEVAWASQNSNRQTHPVGQKKPNELGIYDMSGNLWEWCWDILDFNYYERSPEKDPICEDKTVSAWRKLKRGGCWNSSIGLKVTFRSLSQNEPDEIQQGIRLVRNN